MQSNAYLTSPIEWSRYEGLMHQMDVFIEEQAGYKKVKYAMFQTSIACGCHFGVLTKELLSLRWNDVVGVGAYYFKHKPNRSPILIDQRLKELIKKNMTAVKPLSQSQLIINESLLPTDKVISPRKYNTILQRIFDQFDLDVQGASVQTLQRTFARKVWQELGQTDDALLELSKELGYKIGPIRHYVQL